MHLELSIVWGHFRPYVYGKTLKILIVNLFNGVTNVIVRFVNPTCELSNN